MKILITGFSGFIGSNAFEYFKDNEHEVFGIDNFSRKGSIDNLKRLNKKYNLTDGIDYYTADIVIAEALEEIISKVKPDVIIHLAAQTAVTTSLEIPRFDFMSNALGTFNILEAVRKIVPECIVIYSSTNKVYGSLENEEIELKNDMWDFVYFKGIDENQPLDFHSPYGCSKGTADQYMRDYARIYNLKTVVFRQSCIYGEWQNGSLDQGWVSWITASAIMGKKIQIFGDGKQVRDILYVSDLLNAYNKAIERISYNSGQIFNIGGGFENRLSINQLVTYLERMENKKLDTEYLPERAGDQKIFVSNNDKARFQLFWEPLIDKDYGLDKIYNWTKKYISLWKAS